MIGLIATGVKVVGGTALGVGASQVTKAVLKTAIQAAPGISSTAATIGIAGIGLGVGTGVGIAFSKNVDEIVEFIKIVDGVITEVQNAKNDANASEKEEQTAEV